MGRIGSIKSQIKKRNPSRQTRIDHAYKLLCEGNLLPFKSKKLRKQLAKSNDAEIVDELKKNISWIDKQLKSESVQHTDAAILAEHKKKQREAAKKGKQPFYLSKIIVILLSPPLSL
ncbi:rRNA biogenesis protein RRP36-like isoform X1 [Castanea sativa]|uniref:rRNA biogenesis protein RRP36-like isoform X1 n=1 Tax=Castanea sativa TaxID=21020 RepID=UPI003F6508BF